MPLLPLAPILRLCRWELTLTFGADSFVPSASAIGIQGHPGTDKSSAWRTSTEPEEAGTGLENCIKCTIFIKDMNQFGQINEVYSSYFPENPPARSCVEVARLPKDVDIEIEAIALIP